MRISNVDPEKAKSVLSELSIDQLITTNDDNAYIKVSGQSTAPDALWRAMNESHSTGQGFYMYAPELMVNKFKTLACMSCINLQQMTKARYMKTAKRS